MVKDFVSMSKMLKQWDTRRLELAGFVAKWSKDPNAQVGAVIADRLGRVIALGYNGFSSGLDDNIERLANAEQKLEMIVHAEVNAVLIAGPSAEGGTIYVVGKPVCSRCAGVLIQAGIRRVVAEMPSLSESKWTKSGRLAIDMFKEAHIKLNLIAPPAA
jgi:dCMP deaminase